MRDCGERERKRGGSTRKKEREGNERLAAAPRVIRAVGQFFRFANWSFFLPAACARARPFLLFVLALTARLYARASMQPINLYAISAPRVRVCTRNFFPLPLLLLRPPRVPRNLQQLIGCPLSLSLSRAHAQDLFLSLYNSFALAVSSTSSRVWESKRDRGRRTYGRRRARESGKSFQQNLFNAKMLGAFFAVTIPRAALASSLFLYLSLYSLKK